MANSADAIPFAEISGDPRARGLTYGAVFRDRIRATWRFYAETVFAASRLTTPQIRARAGRVRELVGDFNVDYCVEIEACAEAAHLDPWEIYALNARTEILNAAVGECTAVYVPESRVLGQTWDWIEALENLMVVSKIIRDDGHRIVTLAEPGQLGKIGMNSAGLGVCLNFLVAPHVLDGVPVHILIRAILDCRSLAEVRQALARAGHGKASHYLIADDQGQALSIEFEGANSGVVAPLDGFYAHTNHCIAPTRAANSYVIPTSPERLAAARALAVQHRRAGVDGVKDILAFDDGTAAAIRVQYRPEPLLGGAKVGSCATVIMDLPTRTLHIKKGPGSAAGYTRFSV